MREATELESTVLGVVWLRGPCTAYVVRQEFLASASAHWSGSAGAIYPLLARLEKQGLIKARESEWGRGSKKEFSITRRGMTALRNWIGPPLPEWTAQPTFDPVRTRLSFLGALAPEQRREFVAEARRNLESELTRLRALMAAVTTQADLYEYLSTLGTIHELEGRRRWLEDVEKAVSQEPSPRLRGEGGA
ncbi:MAG TPA: PadR family transcriptional regulator [Thermoanaerobaculia bacterium]|nr:PadR family transcriptional regulator [Thermoanaerobaculia bacterium]